MGTLKRFVKTTLLGGLVVLLPFGILAAVFQWIFNLIRRAIQPLTDIVRARSEEMGELMAVLLVLLILVAACFLVGLAVRTAVGRWLHDFFERRVFKIAPGYNLIKETVMQFLGNRPSPFASVALVNLYGNDTLVTAFVTERHENGWYSVFVPTGPNPTSGNIFHLKPELVRLVDHPVEDVMRSILSCGAGSAPLVRALQEQGRLPDGQDQGRPA